MTYFHESLFTKKSRFTKIKQTFLQKCLLSSAKIHHVAILKMLVKLKKLKRLFVAVLGIVVIDVNSDDFSRILSLTWHEVEIWLELLDRLSLVASVG